MQQPTIIEQSSAAAVEAAKALHWRKSVMKLSRPELAKRSGYSIQAIQLFERGYDYSGRPLRQQALQRYRMVCAGLHVFADFNWNDNMGDVNGQQNSV